MPLVVETGAGLPSGESYTSLEVADAYHAARETEVWAIGDPSAKEAALRRGTQFIDGRYRSRFPGTRTNGRSQALAWPRIGVWDAEGEFVASNEIPAEIVAATAEAALRELIAPGSLTPDTTSAKRVIQQTVGPITTRYSDKGGVDATRPVVTLIDEMLAGLLGRPNLYSGTVVRA